MGLSLSKLMDLSEVITNYEVGCLGYLKVVLLRAIGFKADSLTLNFEADDIRVIDNAAGGDKEIVLLPIECKNYYFELIKWHCTPNTVTREDGYTDILLIKLDNQLVLSKCNCSDTSIIISFYLSEPAVEEAKSMIYKWVEQFPD